MQKQGWEIASSLKKKECKDTKDTLYKGYIKIVMMTHTLICHQSSSPFGGGT